MNEKAEAHARRVGEIVNEAKERGGKQHEKPGPLASYDELDRWKWSVSQAALSWLAAEHANALERIEELEKELADLEQEIKDNRINAYSGAGW